jgi:hypothetical protein
VFPWYLCAFSENTLKGAMQSTVEIELVLAFFLAAIVAAVAVRECWLFYRWLRVLRDYQEQHSAAVNPRSPSPRKTLLPE